MKIYHSKNFHKHTFCLWTEVSQTDFDLQKPQFKSKSGSEYYFTEKGVYQPESAINALSNQGVKDSFIKSIKNNNNKMQNAHNSRKRSLCGAKSY